MPYPNEHACRVREPGAFQDGSLRRIKSGKLSIIIGKLKGATSTTTQAFRYPKSEWSEAEARKHCQDHDGKFEAAASEVQALTVEDCIDPEYSPLDLEEK